MIQSIFGNAANTDGSMIAILAIVAALVSGLVVAWLSLRISFQADAQKNYNDMVGAQSQNFARNAEKTEKAMMRALEKHREEMAKQTQQPKQGKSKRRGGKKSSRSKHS